MRCGVAAKIVIFQFEDLSVELRQAAASNDPLGVPLAREYLIVREMKLSLGEQVVLGVEGSFEVTPRVVIKLAFLDEVFVEVALVVAALDELESSEALCFIAFPVSDEA